MSTLDLSDEPPGKAKLPQNTPGTWRPSVAKFAQRVVELLVVEQALPGLRAILAKEGNLDEAEATVYLLFPFHVMAFSGHFKVDAPLLALGLVLAAVDRAQGQTAQAVTDRLGEYGVALFDHQAIGAGRVEVAEDGLFRLARAGCRNILRRELQDPALLYEVGVACSARLTSWEGGASLKDLFDLYMQLESGDEGWVAGIRRAIHSEKAI